MNLVTLEQISKQYSERLLLDKVDLLINVGDRIGLIGINGSGKTTLLNIIAGQEPPDAGSVTVWGGVRIQFLSQEPQLDESQLVLDCVLSGEAPQLRLLSKYREAAAHLHEHPQDAAWQTRLAELTGEMDRTAGWTAEADAKAILTRLGVDLFETPIKNLSGGQRKRVALARALVDPADLLILDEPTNHIDADTIAWLEEFLVSLPGALLMVTHDRYFLDRVVNRIIELDRRKLVSYPGNYSRYLELGAERKEKLAAAERKHQNLLRRELEWLRRGAMARSTKQKARKQRVEELQRISYDSGENAVALALASRRLGKKVLEATNLSKAYGNNDLFKHVDFSLVPGDRIGIIGPNGAGKSTLLDILAGVTTADSGTITWGETVHLGYYDQLSRDLDPSQRVIDFINDRAPLIRTSDGTRIEAAQMLEWFLFPRPQQRAYIHALSGGERRRLYLLSILALQPNVLFLDEPTNDLDIQTLTVLEQFMDNFEGCLVVVSHDRYFLDRTVDFLATFEDGSFSPRYPAPYSAYQAARQQRKQAAQEAETAVVESTSSRKKEPVKTTDGSQSQKLTWKEARELEALETTIAELEERKAELGQKINSAGGDYEQLQQLTDDMKLVEAKLDGSMLRWLELSEKVS
ncbi:MAG: ABC-F family ATP-binding cassette domain-containing protein [Candidatus Promineifilaceae bacterium]